MAELNEIYLDNAATTRVNKAVAEVVMEVMTGCYGNPSSIHRKGVQARERLMTARAQVSAVFGCESECVTFTSGGTEANNLAVFGAVKAKKRRGNKIITTAIEHSSVMLSMRELETQGYEVVWIKPTVNGQFHAEDFIREIDDQTILVSVMYLNNETGALLPVEDLFRQVHRQNPQILTHCDAVQAYGKIPLRVNKLDVDLMSVSGHKIAGPKGVGALYMKRGVRISPRTFGGAQESGLRSGTEALPLICGFGKASALVMEGMGDKLGEYQRLHDLLLEDLTKIENICINSPVNSAPYIVNLSMPGYRSEIMLHFLEGLGIYVSSGSACAKGEKSHVLTAMGLSPGRIDSAIRVSFGCETSEADVHNLADALLKAKSQLIRV